MYVLRTFLLRDHTTFILQLLSPIMRPFKNSLLIITFDLNEQFFFKGHRRRLSNGKPTSKLELTMERWKATLKQFFEEDNTSQKTVASYTFLKRVSALDAHWRRQVRILTAVLSYFKVYLRGMSAAQAIWRPKDRVFNKQ